MFTGTVPVLALFTGSDAGRLARALALADLLTAPMRPVPTLEVGAVPEDAILVDVREPRERAVSRIVGSIDEDTLQTRLDTLGDRPVVFWCTVGYRSHTAAARWQDRGLDARNLRGGILAWTHAALPIETPAGEPTRRVHTYDRWWALQPRAFEAVW